MDFFIATGIKVWVTVRAKYLVHFLASARADSFPTVAEY